MGHIKRILELSDLNVSHTNLYKQMRKAEPDDVDDSLTGGVIRKSLIVDKAIEKDFRRKNPEETRLSLLLSAIWESQGRLLRYQSVINNVIIWLSG
jgi:hypothetical protein